MPGLSVRRSLPVFSVAAFDWSAYWASQTDLFLFFAEVSKVSDGKLYNQMRGSSDYLTVAGAAGSYTFQCPNTADYIAADYDYLWFQIDTSQRTVTEAELIGYDFQATPIKYDDADPYTLRWIAIRKSGVTFAGTDKIKLYQSFYLPILWDGTLNAYGHIKGNRYAWNPWRPPDEVIEYCTGLVTPLSDDQTLKLNTFVRNLKIDLGIDNLSDIFDCMYILAGETEESSLKNIVKNAHHCTNISATIFTALEGFTGDGIADSLLTNYIPSTDGVNYVLNDAGFGIYARTTRVAGTQASGGANVGRLRLYPLRGAALAAGEVNSAAVYFTFPAADCLGMTSIFRDGAHSCYGAKNKTLSTVTDIVSTAVLASNVYLLSYSLTLFDSIQISFAYLSKSLNQAQMNSLFDNFEAYMDSNGKGVVS